MKRNFALMPNTRIMIWQKPLKDADVFIGLSVGNVVTPEMVKSMAKNPIVFAMANPDPEINYEVAVAARKDIIMATGRSDYPNQVNNVLGFPYIFRGALDVRATADKRSYETGCSKGIGRTGKSAGAGYCKPGLQ